MDEFSLVTSDQEHPKSGPSSDEFSLISDNEEFKLLSSDDEEVPKEVDEGELEITASKISNMGFSNSDNSAEPFSADSYQLLETDEDGLAFNNNSYDARSLSDMEQKESGNSKTPNSRRIPLPPGPSETVDVSDSLSETDSRQSSSYESDELAKEPKKRKKTKKRRLGKSVLCVFSNRNVWSMIVYVLG